MSEARCRSATSHRHARAWSASFEVIISAGSRSTTFEPPAVGAMSTMPPSIWRTRKLPSSRSTLLVARFSDQPASTLDSLTGELGAGCAQTERQVLETLRDEILGEPCVREAANRETLFGRPVGKSGGFAARHRPSAITQERAARPDNPRRT